MLTWYAFVQTRRMSASGPHMGLTCTFKLALHFSAPGLLLATHATSHMPSPYKPNLRARACSVSERERWTRAQTHPSGERMVAPRSEEC